MRLIAYDDLTAPWPPAAVALGTFDGVHLGHQALLRRTAALSASLGLTAAAMTFAPSEAAMSTPRWVRQSRIVRS